MMRKRHIWAVNVNKMLIIDLERLVVSRGGHRVTSYLTQRGFTYAEARGLAHGDRVVQIRDRTVQQLCEVFVCEPSDLFCWCGEESGPLVGLKRRYERPWHELLEGRSQAEVEEFWAKASEMTSHQMPAPKTKGGQLTLDVGRLVRQRTAGGMHAYLKGIGLGAMVARTLLNGEQRALRLSVMTLLCQRLVCVPSDLYRFDGPEDHVLAPLMRPLIPDASGLTGEVLRKLAGG